MRALLLDRLPNVATAKKDDADRPLNGVKVNDAALVQALLNYGTYDVYYYIRESAKNSKAEAFENPDRLQALDLESLELLTTKAPEELILFTSSHHLAKFVPFRQFCGHTEWPICGLTHGLSSNTLIPAYSWNYFAAIKSYDAIICTSKSGKQALYNLFQLLSSSRSIAGVRGFFPPRMPLIPLGIDLSSQENTWRPGQSSSKKGFVVLCVGRLTASYKADLRPLIAAFLRPNLLPNDSTLIIAGDDTQSHIAPSLQQFAQSFPSDRKVVVMPDISDQVKSALLRTADVALCMSDTYQETFGISVLEAMAAGLPVVAPYWNGYQDLVQHGSNGFLAPTTVCKDTGYLSSISMLIDPAFALGQRVIIDMEAILHYLSLLSKFPVLAQQMGERGKELARTQYSWKSVIERYEALWGKLILKGKQLRRGASVETLGFMDYDRVFEGYPTSYLAPERKVTVNEQADDLLAFLYAGSLFSPPPIAGFSEELDRRILEACKKRHELTLSQLIELVANPAIGRSAVITQISRLAKYGLLSIFPTQGNTFPRRESKNEVVTDHTLSPVGV